MTFCFIGDSVDEGIGSSSPARSESSLEDVKRELIELRLTLERERSLRTVLEEQIRNLESQLNVAESVHDPAHQNHDLPYHSSSEVNLKFCSHKINLILFCYLNFETVAASC